MGVRGAGYVDEARGRAGQPRRHPTACGLLLRPGRARPAAQRRDQGRREAQAGSGAAGRPARSPAPAVRPDVSGPEQGPALPDLRQIFTVSLMRRPDKPNPPDEPLLFDLPLGDPEPEPARLPRRKPERTARSGPVPVPDPEPEEVAAPRPAGEFAGRAKRLAAGPADLMLHAAILGAALVGTRWMGVNLDPTRDWPALAVFLLSFSFL